MPLQQDRRALHRIPELDRHLPKTMEYLKNALSGLKCQVFSPMEGALCAWFDYGQPSAIAFRSDADALPVEETTKAPYASTHPGPDARLRPRRPHGDFAGTGPAAERQGAA